MTKINEWTLLKSMQLLFESPFMEKCLFIQESLGNFPKKIK